MDATAVMRAQAVELHCHKSWSYTRIGEKLGVTRQRAHQLVQEALEELAAEQTKNVEALRAREIALIEKTLERTSEVMAANVVEVTDDGEIQVHKGAGELALKAADRVVKLSERRAKLLGLDAPTVSNVNLGATPLSELEKIQQAAKANEGADECDPTQPSESGTSS